VYFNILILRGGITVSFAEDVNSDIEFEAPKVTKAAAPPKKRVQKQHIVSSDSEEDEAPKATKAAPAARKKQQQQQQLRGSDSEEEPPAKVTKAAPAKKRLQKATTTGAKENEKVAVVEESSSVSVVDNPEPTKVRKIKVSPFNKKTKALTSKEVMEAAVAEAANRPQRAAAGRRKVQYIISDSSEEDKGESESDASVFSDTESF
jgi:hypothetical protein